MTALFDIFESASKTYQTPRDQFSRIKGSVHGNCLHCRRENKSWIALCLLLSCMYRRICSQGVRLLTGERAHMSPIYALTGDMLSTAAELSFDVSAVYPQQSCRYQRSHLNDSASVSGEKKPPASAVPSRICARFRAVLIGFLHRPSKLCYVEYY